MSTTKQFVVTLPSGRPIRISVGPCDWGDHRLLLLIEDVLTGVVVKRLELTSLCREVGL